MLFLCQRLNAAISSPADDVIPQNLLLTNGFYFQHISGIHAPVGKRKDFLYPVEVPPHSRQLSYCHNGKEAQRVKFTRN
jgi:hypothetical protein